MIEPRSISPEKIFAGETEYSADQFKSDLIELNNETLASTGNLDSLTALIDEILQDLIDEIDNLRHQELFENDKVSQVYLQGLDKIGHYVQSEGARAHPNSIKLLLSLYYDFEKILSSDHITGAEITALLKADVRKFKILQHQIARKHGVATSSAEDVGTPLPLSDHRDLLGVQAAILELDWEVTDEGLANLSTLLDELKTQYEDNHTIKVIIHGLYSLNSYLTEEKGRAHPETFSLIHNFYDALEALIEDKDLDEEKKKEILIDRVNRLNNLKNLIAQTYSTEDLAPEAISPVTEADEELSLDVDITPGADDLDLDLEIPAEDEAPAKPASAVEMLVPVGDGEDDDEYDEPLVAEGEELPPALSDSSEESGFGSSGDLEAPPDELEEKLDFFFGSDKEEFKPEAIEEAATRKAEEERAETPVAEEFEDEIAPALAGSVEEAGFTDADGDMEAPPEELADKLDSFFGPDREQTPEPEVPVEAAAPAETEEEPFVAFEAEDGGVEEEIAPALADSDDEIGFTGEGEDLEAPPEELAGNLDAFFGPDEEITPEAATPAEAEARIVTADELPAAFEAENDEAIEEIAPALAGSDEVAGFAEGEGDAAPPEELTDKLDSFFGPDDDKITAAEAAETEEEVLLTPALEEPVAEAIETAPAVATAEEFQAAVDKMHASYQELETSIR
ncbi:MAG: hypothetical protein L3J79_08320, partial [Candidatus Marinimicrobia bacterium]|nr:hypothetical protein [Candidatus Neomarinimicrobiota bacterium]